MADPSQGAATMMLFRQVIALRHFIKSRQAQIERRRIGRRSRVRSAHDMSMANSLSRVQLVMLFVYTWIFSAKLKIALLFDWM